MFSLTFYFHCTHFPKLQKYLIGRLLDRKPDKLLPRTLYRIRVTAHAILKVRKEDAMNDSLLTIIKL